MPPFSECCFPLGVELCEVQVDAQLSWVYPGFTTIHCDVISRPRLAVSFALQPPIIERGSSFILLLVHIHAVEPFLAWLRLLPCHTRERSVSVWWSSKATAGFKVVRTKGVCVCVRPFRHLLLREKLVDLILLRVCPRAHGGLAYVWQSGWGSVLWKECTHYTPISRWGSEGRGCFPSCLSAKTPWRCRGNCPWSLFQS